MQNLVLIPGLGSDAAVWERTIHALRGQVTCYISEIRDDDSLREMALHILQSVPQLFTLAGVSMGGMIALEMVRIAPERVTSLALLDTNARADTAGQKLYRQLSNLLVKRFDFKRLSEFSIRSLVHTEAGPDVKAELVAMALRLGPETYIRQNRALMARTDLRPSLRQIAVPTAVVVGMEDRMTPVKLSQEIHEMIAGSTLHLIDGCGHLPPIEKPEMVAQILLQLMHNVSG